MTKMVAAYAELISLKENLPTGKVEEYFVNQYHSALELLKDLIDKEIIDRFKVESAEVNPKITRGNYVTGQKNYSSKSYCDSSKLLAKIDTTLNYLTLESSGDDRKKIASFRSGIN